MIINLGYSEFSASESLCIIIVYTRLNINYFT
jgi:hypothetical protein